MLILEFHDINLKSHSLYMKNNQVTPILYGASLIALINFVNFIRPSINKPLPTFHPAQFLNRPSQFPHCSSNVILQHIDIPQPV